VTDPAWLVPLSDIVVDDELVAAAEETVRSGWWSMGPKVEELEHEFGLFCDSRHAIAVSSGTAALHLALLALGCGPGDEVILPSLNFVAGANVIRHVGAVPIFCDIHGRDDLNLDPADIDAAVGPATKAILALHYGGFPCDMDGVRAVAQANGLSVIEDAAHAPGARWRGQACGSIGAIGCFSFFANKNLSAGEGGMVVTDHDELAQRLRLLRSHGMTTLTWDRHRGHARSYDVVAHGFNYRMDEIRAAIALVQLRRLPVRNTARARIDRSYRAALHGANGITIPFQRLEAGSVSAHHLTVAVLPTDVQAETVREALRARRIQTSVHYPPIHRFSAFDDRRRKLPRTERVAESLMTLPLFPHMTDDQVDRVISCTLEAVRCSGGLMAG
jgi:dTDP-4-amino-4,6-dideoxygalactose transaminase